MTAELMNGIYYEYVGRYMDTYDIKKVDVPEKEARLEACNTEKDLYLTTYKDGVLENVSVLVGNKDMLDYPRTIGNTYYEELPGYMKLRYALLSRLQMDCNYVLSSGKGALKYLEDGSVEKHIAEMKRRWNEFDEDEKPEWLTMKQIEEYEGKLLAM